MNRMAFIWMKEKNVMISVPTGTDMKRFAPVAIHVAKSYENMTVHMDVIPGAQLEVKKTDTVETLLNRFATVSFIKSPKPKNTGPSS